MTYRAFLKHFDERQIKEIRFSGVYATDYNHGTDGHNSKMIIAKFTELMTLLEVAVHANDMDKIKELMGIDD